MNVRISEKGREIINNKVLASKLVLTIINNKVKLGKGETVFVDKTDFGVRYVTSMT